MNTRLQQFLVAENISQAQLAETIGVARAGISHIISGRNKPGFDFIESLSRHYPALNLEWLITGTGRMYKQDAAARDIAPLKPAEPEYDLFSAPASSEPAAATGTMPEKPLRKAESPAPKASIEENLQSIRNSRKATVTDRKISRIVVFFSDNTFEEFE